MVIFGITLNITGMFALGQKMVSTIPRGVSLELQTEKVRLAVKSERTSIDNVKNVPLNN